MPLSQKEIDEAARQFLTQGPYAYLKQQVTADYQDPTDPYNDYNAAPSEQTFQKMAQAGDDLKNAIAGGGMGGVTNALDSAGFYLNSLGNYARGIGKAYNAAIGSELGMNAVGNVADNAGDWFYDKAGNTEKTAGEYQAKVSDPNNLVYQTLSGSASSIPMMLSSAALSLPFGGLPAMATLMGGSEAAGTAGGLYRRLRAQGMSDQEAKDAANRLFWSEAPLDIASENIFGMFGKLAPKVAPRVAEGMGKVVPSGLLRSVLGEGLQEGAQETYQEWLQNAAEKSAGQPLSGYGSALLEEGKNLPEYMRTQGLPGALSGMLMAGVGGAVSSIRQNRAQTPQEKQTIANVQKVQEAFANAAQAGHVYTAPGATENVGTATAAAPMPSTTGTGFEGVDISKGFSPTTTTTATLPGQLVPQGLSDIANPSQGTISTAGFPLPGVIPTTAPTTPSGKPQQTVTQGNTAQVGQAIATTPQPAAQPTAQPTAQTPGDVTRVPVSVRGGTDENGNFVLGSDVGDAIKTLIGINGQQPTQSPQAPAQRPAVPANISRVVTPDGNTEIETHYAVVPAESLITSNTADFGVNQAYPAELQPRDRTRTANQTNVMNITRNLDPARLADSRLTSEGAPIVDANGVVESGNGRTLALMRGYREGAQTMQGYRQYLLDNAARLGLDPAQVAGVQNPVLVRVRDTQMTPEQRVAFANASNRSSIAGMSATEQARMDAGNLTADILATYNPDLQQTAAGQRDFHKAFLATIPQNEHNNLINERGEPTPQLIQRERNALVFAATGDEQLAARMTETNDDNVKTVSAALIQAAPRLARINAEMKAGRLRSEYDLSKDLADAANWLSELRANGQKVEDHLNQLNAFSELDRSDETKMLLKFFDENKRAAKIGVIRDALVNYANSVEHLGGPNEQSLFDDVTPPSKMDLLRSALDRAMSGEGTQGTLFGNKDMMYIGQAGALRLDTTEGLKYDEDKASRMYNNWIAEQMEKEGKDARTILLATGWQRLKDGLWRYELPDGTFTPVPGADAVTKSRFTIGDVYDDKQLFDAYPDLKNIPLFFKNLGPNIGGYVGSLSSTGERVIVINTNCLNLKTRVLNINGRKTLLHELQHMVQGKEGFASGGDDAAGNAVFKRQYGDRIARLDDWLYKNLHENMFDWKSGTGALGEAQIKRAYYAAALTNDSSLSDAEKQLAQKRISDQDEAIAAARETLKEVYSDLDEQTVAEARRMEPEAAHVYGLQRADTYFKYWALGGENEARNTANRLGKSMSERRSLTFNDTADIADESTITHDADSPSPPLRDPNPAPKPAPKPAPTTGGFFGGQGTLGFGDDGGTQGTLFSRNAPAVQTAKQIAAEVQAVRKQLVDDLKAAGRDEQSAKAEAQIVAAYFGRTANEARKAGMALSVRDQYERFKVEQGIAPQKGENVYEQDVGANKKAPNDRLSNLTPTQWRQVRTAEFKNWFGDWESAALLKQARNAWTDNNSKGKYAFAPSERLSTELRRLLGHDVESIVITDSTIRHLKNHHGNLKETERGQLSLTPEDIATIPYIVNNYDEVLRSPEYDDKMGNRALEIRKRINGVSVIATIEKGERKNFVVTSWHKKKTGALDAQSAPGLYVRNDPAVLTSIKQDMAKIKTSLDNSSKVVDENGEPLVVYHGTGTPDITEFKHSKATDKTGRMMGLGQGKGKFYFTSNRTGAESAASAAVARGQGKTATVMPVYLRLTNPISLAEYESRYEKLSGHPIFESYSGNYTSDVRDKYIAQLDRAIKKEGYDGIVGEDRGLYVAFSPNQIKSVNNRGKFDSSGNIYNQIAWHGSPFEFDKFTLDHMGEGEGSQAHGWGLYFAKDRTTATDYRSMADTGFTYRGRDINELYRKLERSEEYDKLAVLESFMTELDTETMPWEDFDEDAAKWFKKEILPNVKSGGKLYSANIPENDVLLDEQKSLKEQPLEVKRAVASLAKDNNVQITGGMTGREMYNQLAEALGSPKAASLALNDAGVKGITYESDRDGRCFVVFDDKAISTLERYYQENAKNTPQDYSGLRGQISFMDTGEATRDATITLFNSDRSTFVHEVGHKMLDDLVHLGQNPDAGAVFKQDLQVAMDWLGVKNASEIGTEQHEKFARAFERYLMEGEAPTSKLAEVFEHFKQWLIDIYRNVANLDVELSPEVRALFDRLLGKESTTQQTESTTAASDTSAQKNAPQEAGRMSPKEFDKWMRKTQHDGIPIQKYHTQFQRFAKTVQALEETQNVQNLRAVEQAQQKLEKIEAQMPQPVLDTYRRNANANQSVLKAERLRAEYEAILKNQREYQERIKWGREYSDIKGKEAIKFLLEEKSGWVRDAFHIPNFGYVSLVYGEAGNPQNEYKPGYGLAHIIAKHGMDAVDIIPKALKNGTITPSTKENNKFDVVYGNYKIVIKSEWTGNKINWLVTSFEHNDITEDTKNSPRVAKIPVVDDLTRETQSSPDVDYMESLPQTKVPRNTHAEITGPALKGRGAAFQSQQGRDYSMDYATGTPSTPTPTPASVKKSRVTIRDIAARLNEIRPWRKGVNGPKNVLGYTNPTTRVARTRWNQDWITATHEIGHIVDYQLRLRQRVNANLSAEIDTELQALGQNTSPPNSDAAYLRKEGIAEFFRLRAIVPQLAESFAPKYSELFDEALADDPDLQQKINAIFDVEREYWEMSPEEKVRAGLRQGDEKESRGPLGGVLKAWWEKRREEFDDRFRRIERLQEVMRDRAVAAGRTDMLQNGQLKDEYAPYDMVRTAPGFLGKAKTDVEAIMAPIRKLGTEAYDQLVTYMTARGAIDYWNNGMEPGIATNRQQTEDVIRRFELEHPDLVKAYKDILNAYENMVRRTMVDSGVWSEQQYEAYKKKYPNYVPFIRVNEDGSLRNPGSAGGNKVVNLSNQVKRRKGVGSEHAFMEIADPYESMVKNILTYHKIAEKNRVGQTFINAVKADPGVFADLIEPVEGNEIGKDSFYVWEDGKKKYYAADKDILNAINALEEAAPNHLIAKAAMKASNWLKFGATRANFAFIITNFVRDGMFSTMTGSGWGVPFYRTVKGLAMQMSKDPETAKRVAEALDSGLAYSGITELDMNSSRESIAKSIKRALGDDSLFSKVTSAWDNSIGRINEMIEVAPKYAEYEKLVKQGYPKRYAARMAREVNLDFSRGGSVAKNINRYVAFFNPAIQGVSKIARTAAANPGKFLAKTALYVMIPSIISWAMGHDDDEYKRLSRSIKDRYWVFKTPGGTWVRISKPDIVGQFGSAVERILDKAADKDPAAFRGLGTSIAEAVFPSYMPTVLGPLMETWSNKSFFYGEQLIPQSLEKLPPEMQYRRDTSELAKGLSKGISSTAKFLGQEWGVSPIIIDNLIKGYTGGVGEYISKIPDQFIKPEGEARKFSERPVISRFTVDPYRSSESINRFYDIREKTETAKNGFKALAKQGERGEVSRDVKAAKMFEKAGKRLSELNKDIARIREAKGVSPEKKRERIDRIQLERNRLAERILAQYDKMK